MTVDMDINSMYAGVYYTPYIPKMTLRLSESRIHGARYYTIEPVFGNWGELEEWATHTYGQPSTIWDVELGRWYMNNSKFWFRDQADVTVFVLRWD